MVIPRRRVASTTVSSLGIWGLAFVCRICLHPTSSYAYTRTLVNNSDLVKPKLASNSSRKSDPPVKSADLLFDLANTEDQGIATFRRKWDRLYRRYSNRELLTLRDELRLLWGHVTPLDEAEWRDQPASVTLGDVCSGMTEGQKQLFKRWLTAPPWANESLEGVICQRWLNQEKGGTLVYWTPTEKRIRANPRSLPVVLAWACVNHAEHLGFCRNPECANPYFIAGRNDQRYCSPECAHPAKKAAKLKWWRENRGKDPQVRKAEPTRGTTKKGP